VVALPLTHHAFTQSPLVHNPTVLIGGKDLSFGQEFFLCFIPSYIFPAHGNALDYIIMSIMMDVFISSQAVQQTL
jgi:hypothetical protein